VISGAPSISCRAAATSFCSMQIDPRCSSCGAANATSRVVWACQACTTSTGALRTMPSRIA
jgi:hypothetical protein